MAEIRAISVGDTVEVRSPSAGRWTGEVVSWVSSAGETNRARIRCITPPTGTGHGIQAGQTTVVPLATLLPLTPPDRISIGDSVTYASAVGPWTGEVLEIFTTTALVRPVDPGHAGSDPYELPLADLTRTGDPDGMRDDGCDDVNVTGRVRPMHRHAVSGRAHAHPNGGEPHTHQQLRSPLVSVLPASDDRPRPDAPPDPVEILAQEVATFRRVVDMGYGWIALIGLPDVTEDDRDVARHMLAALVARPWHLVTLVDGDSGATDVMWQP